MVLVNSRNPLNIGAAARAMSNFGVERLRVVHPYEVAFREARSAVGAEPILAAAEEFESLAPAIADCSLVVGTTGRDLRGAAGTKQVGGRTQRQSREPLLRLEEAAERIRATLGGGGNVALLFGSEKVGLSNREMERCQLLLRIPTRDEHPSMNLGQAVAVVLYELIRQTGAEPVAALPAAPAPTAAERERLIAVLLEALTLGGYAHGGLDPEPKVRRLVRHLELTAADLREWLSLVRQLVWKLKNGVER